MNRKLQLDIVNEYCDSSFSLNEEDKINFLTQILDTLHIKEDKNKYQNSIFFCVNGVVYMELIGNNLYCSYGHIWSIFENEFNMEYHDIQFLIQIWMEKHFKLESIKPKKMFCEITEWY